MSLPKEQECPYCNLTEDDAATHLGVPKFFVPVLADSCPDLVIEGNVVMAKRESNGPVIFTLLGFIAIITIAGLLGN